MEAVNIKQEARRLIDKLPDDATWDDVMHEIYVRQAVEAGLADSEAGRMTSVEDVRSKFGLPQ
jgi:predicted transcriptional regulator